MPEMQKSSNGPRRRTFPWLKNLVESDCFLDTRPKSFETSGQRPNRTDRRDVEN